MKKFIAICVLLLSFSFMSAQESLDDVDVNKDLTELVSVMANDVLPASADLNVSKVDLNKPVGLDLNLEKQNPAAVKVEVFNLSKRTYRFVDINCIEPTPKLQGLKYKKQKVPIV